MTYQYSQHFQKNLLDTPVNEAFSIGKALIELLSPQALPAAATGDAGATPRERGPLRARGRGALARPGLLPLPAAPLGLHPRRDPGRGLRGPLVAAGRPDVWLHVNNEP